MARKPQTPKAATASKSKSDPTAAQIISAERFKLVLCIATALTIGSALLSVALALFGHDTAAEKMIVESACRRFFWGSARSLDCSAEKPSELLEPPRLRSLGG